MLLKCLFEGDEPSFETLPYLLILSDMYLIDTVSSKCLEWVRNLVNIKNDPEKLELVLYNICKIQKEVYGKLPQIGEAWDEVRDQVVSKLLSGATRAATLEKWVQMIVDSQSAEISWPTTLAISGRYIDRLAPLKALTHLTFKTRFHIVDLEKLQHLPLNVLIFSCNCIGEAADWEALSKFNELRTLKCLEPCEGYEGLCKQVENNQTLINFTLPPHRPLLGESLKKIDIKRMLSLSELEILQPCSYESCALLFEESETLETLIVNIAQASPYAPSFSLKISRFNQSLEVVTNPSTLANFRARFPAIPKQVSDQFFNAFPFVENIIFSLKTFDGDEQRESVTIHRMPSKEPEKKGEYSV